MLTLQRLIPLLALPLAWGTFALWPDVGPVEIAGFLAPGLFALWNVLRSGNPRAHLPAQSWALGTLHPILAWAIGLGAAAALDAWSPTPAIGPPLGVLLCAIAALFLHLLRPDRFLVAPPLDDTHIHAQTTLGLAFAIHGVAPGSVLPVLEGATVRLIPPHNRDDMGEALRWAEGRINLRARGRSWPTTWERSARMDRMAVSALCVFQQVHARWSTARLTLDATPPSAHALLAAKAALATQGRPA